MGRGRAKAKQVKVARQLKYHQPNMDLESLQRELSGNKGSDHSAERSYDDAYEDSDYSEYADKYADEYADEYSDYEDDYSDYAEWADESGSGSSSK